MSEAVEKGKVFTARFPLMLEADCRHPENKKDYSMEVTRIDLSFIVFRCSKCKREVMVWVGR